MHTRLSRYVQNLPWCYCLICLSSGLPIAMAVELPDAGPWTDVWTMDLRGNERAFVVYEGRNYLWGRLADLQPKHLEGLLGQDFAIKAKYNRRQGNNPMFYGFGALNVEAQDPTLAAAIDGSNFILFGKLSGSAAAPILQVESVHPSPSDAQVISDRLKALQAHDYQAHFDLADWAQGEAQHHGNRGFWLDTADNITVAAIRRAAAAAAEKRDLKQLQTAMRWALDIAKRKDLAAELASASWVFSFADEELADLRQLLKSLDLRLYDDGKTRSWMSPERFLRTTFDNRFASIRWNDAEGFYQLGLWAEEHGDILPQAELLAHSAFQAGQKADPGHAGIKQMLSLSKAGFEASDLDLTARQVQPFKSPDSMVDFQPPKGWNRNDRPISSECDATWTHRLLPTSYLGITASVFTGTGDFERNWQYVRDGISLLTDFQAGDPRDDTSATGQRLRSLTFTFTALDGPRRGIISLIQAADHERCASLRVIYEKDYAETSETIYRESLDRVRFNRPPEAPASAPAQEPAPAP